MPGGPICLFASSPEVRELGFLVQVLAGTPAELAERSVALGYDGFEFMPDPERVPDPEPFRRAVRDAGADVAITPPGEDEVVEGETERFDLRVLQSLRHEGEPERAIGPHWLPLTVDPFVVTEAQETPGQCARSCS
jgi:hypothetical protein